MYRSLQVGFVKQFLVKDCVNVYGWSMHKCYTSNIININNVREKHSTFSFITIQCIKGCFTLFWLKVREKEIKYHRNK